MHRNFFQPTGSVLEEFRSGEPRTKVPGAGKDGISPVLLRGHVAQVVIATSSKEASQQKVVLKCLCVIRQILGDRIQIRQRFPYVRSGTCPSFVRRSNLRNYLIDLPGGLVTMGRSALHVGAYIVD